MRLEIDGLPIFAATGGRPFDPALPAVLFLHGAGMDHSVWSLQARYFAHHGRAVLAADLPGHGRSGGAPLASIEAMAGWAERLLASLGLEAAALVGHSMGALVALEAAARLGRRCRGLALLGVAARMPVHPDLMAAAAADDRLAPELIAAWGHGPAGHLGGHPAPGLWMIGGALRLLERAAPGLLAADLAACASYAGAAAAAARVTAPALFILGAEDRMTPPRQAQPLQALMPEAASVVLPGTGHMVMIERPDATTDALRRIL